MISVIFVAPNDVTAVSAASTGSVEATPVIASLTRFRLSPVPKVSWL